MVKGGNRGKSLVSVTIYVEGGGADSFDECRKAFRIYCEKLAPNKMPRIKASGSRSEAYKDFCLAVKQAEAGEQIVLVVDSEDPVLAQGKWQHLSQRPGDGWTTPPATGEANIYLMVTCMETWFLADKDAFVAFYEGDRILVKHLACNPEVESIPRGDVQDKLAAATAQCTKRGPYHKVRHGLAILPTLNPAIVEVRAPHAREFNDFIRAL
jgi:hypothetical protein